jgi:hypothetical protein
MTSLCERTADKSAYPTRSENCVSHRPPPSTVCTPFYTAFTRLGGANASYPQYRLETVERPRTADLPQLRVYCRWLLSVARVCISCITTQFFVLSIARYCSALRPG